jgi:hypothetical protein
MFMITDAPPVVNDSHTKKVLILYPATRRHTPKVYIVQGKTIFCPRPAKVI